jgi:hypothetical protein
MTENWTENVPDYIHYETSFTSDNFDWIGSFQKTSRPAPQRKVEVNLPPHLDILVHFTIAICQSK